MKKFICLLLLAGFMPVFSACGNEATVGNPNQDGAAGNSETTAENDIPEKGKILVVYYSYTNNIHTIVTDLLTQVEADAVRIEPARKGLDYAADNYAIGSEQIAAIRNNPDNASSYPEIDRVDVDLTEYQTIIVAAPLWWSSMAAPLQTFLFDRGDEMADKNIALIVSSASTGISGVEADARRLIPNGKFLVPSLWIRSSQTSQCHGPLSEWLNSVLPGVTAGDPE